MSLEADAPRLAVLIDAENVSASIAGELFDKITTIGEASVRKIYGDFSHSRLKSWSSVLSKYALEPRHQKPCVTGKNSADIMLVIDAMESIAQIAI